MKLSFPAILVLLLLLAPARGNVISYYDPIYGDTVVVLNTDLTNTDSGSTYDSYDTEIFADLAASLWAAPHNQSNYPLVSDMLDDWSLDISESGDVWDGWQHDSNYSNLEITHYGLGPDPWNTDANSDMMRLTLNIPLSQLDGDGDGWSAEDPNDYRIEQGPETSNMGVGHHGINTFSADGTPYIAQQNPQATSNGTSIVWLEGYGYTNGYELATQANPDGDGYKNWQEYILDTSATNATEEFSAGVGTNGYALRFGPSSTGRTYTIMRNEDLRTGTWFEVETLWGSAGETAYGVPSNGYYKVRVNQP